MRFYVNVNNVEVTFSHIKSLTICSYYNDMFFFIITLTSVFELSVKAYRALCFPLKVGRSAMAYFCLLHSSYDMEVILVYDTEVVLLYFFFYYLILWYVTCTLIVTYYLPYINYSYQLYYLY